MNLAELGDEIHSRRVKVGLLQEHVARFAGLSRVTINQLENGTLKDLGYTKLKTVMDILGIGLEPVQRSQLKSALAVAARSVSTSFRDELTPEMLAIMLRSGEAPTQFQPHLMALLDEVPLPVVVNAVAEAATPDLPPKRIMKNLRVWAERWKVCRAVW